uniref:Ig-like domain-containing protein n=1 Tax=Meloidogyne enterolobii TaxID=390850 RepID=A0A6V7XZT1_MELEN|nr:unnamed protein product [Meloidogyne enterolobii]
MRRKNAKMSTASTISSTTLASINIDEDVQQQQNQLSTETTTTNGINTTDILLQIGADGEQQKFELNEEELDDNTNKEQRQKKTLQIINAAIEQRNSKICRPRFFARPKPHKQVAEGKSLSDFFLLEVHSLSVFDSGLYNCTAKNTEGVAFCSANVQVVELATPKSSTESLIKTESPINQRMKRQKSRSEQMAPEIIEALPHEAKAISGDQFIAECRVLGNPIPSICWLHNNTRITPNSDHIVLSFDGELSKLFISKISSLDSGRYIFIAENSSGTVRSEMNLLVNKAIREDDLLSPKFIESKVRLRHQIEIGDNGVSQREIVLLAEIIEGTEPITIKWFTPNRVEITNNHLNAYRIDRVGKDSRLTIFDAFPTDSGDYKCLAENKFGTAKCIFELKITEKNNFNYNIEQKPPTVSAKQSTIYAKQGQRFVDLIFSVFGDETVICWYRIVQDSEQHIIPNTKKYEANNKDNGQCVSLRIYDLQINDASQYKIVAINRCGEASGVIKLFVNTNINISEKKKSALTLTKTCCDR